MYDYRYEPHRLIFMIDNKSFFASCEAVRLGINPMKAVLAVVSRQPHTKFGSGLIMAASPLAKKKYNLNNVMRARDLPSKREAPDLKLVEPHMNLYIKRSMQVLNIFRKYAAEEDIHVYSIDESMIDMTKSWHLFGNDPYLVARKIQKDIHDTLGLYTTCGIGENPLLAKLAMDISAKHKISMIAYWHYIDVPDTIWKIPKLEDVWGIGKRTAKRLRKLGINNMYQLAHTDPATLKQEFGVIGEQLFAMSWGVDRSIISHKFFPKMKNYGNSQVLTRDYVNQREIEIVLREIGEQVGARIRAHKLQASCVGLYVGFSEYKRNNQRKGFSVQQRISPTNSNQSLVHELVILFRKNWHGEPVRVLGVNYSKLIPDTGEQLTFFMSPDQQLKKRKFTMTVDKIRQKYGFTSLVKASSLSKGATAIKRSNLVGGHNGGNAYE
ncbi:Y-family DNA polymerase [Lactobacillus acetotolerans]|uniref:Y-family DNA polymerase n=1 Tax=Lactobacillus acetotolerans TaxID=1600 RepID=UPI00241E3938|nr:Y-family DNA polymerase [Lactobacillus acetotolerans]